MGGMYFLRIIRPLSVTPFKASSTSVFALPIAKSLAIFREIISLQKSTAFLKPSFVSVSGSAESQNGFKLDIKEDSGFPSPTPLSISSIGII